MNKIQIALSSCYCIGDIHGNFDCIGESIRSFDMMECVMIFCGDVGIGFQSQSRVEEILRGLEKECDGRNVYCLFIRGNHDDPAYFDGRAVDYPHVKAVPDYTVIQLLDKSILCVGGAISVDRTFRLNAMRAQAASYAIEHGLDDDKAMRFIPKCYWSREAPFFDEYSLSEISESGMKITNVVTHTCPDFCEPITKDGVSSWIKQDYALAEDLRAERKAMTDIYRKLIQDEHPIKGWYYGHYHYHHFECIHNVNYYLLDMERGGHSDMVEIR